MTYTIAINRSYVGKVPFPAPEGLWGEFNGQFRNETLTIEQFANAICKGFACTTWHAFYRKAANFVQGQHIGLDFDTEDERSTFPALMADPFINRYATILHTTPSHKAEKPRARVIFLLDRPIRDAQKYVLLTNALLWKYAGADETCKDACRLFFGAKDCDVLTPGNILTLEDAATHLVNPYKEHLAEIERQREEARQAAREKYGDVQADDQIKAWYINSAFDREHDSLARAGHGVRHKGLLQAAIRLGSFLNTTWVPIGLVDEQRIYDTLLSASVKNGEIKDYGELNSRQTIRDGISYAKPRDEPIWRLDEEGETVADEQEQSQLLPEIALTPEQAARERQAIEAIRREAWWKGYHAGMSASVREFWQGMGASDAYINALQLGYDDQNDDLTIPYLSPGGELLNIEYRQSVDPALVSYETELPSLLQVKAGQEDSPILLLPDALEAIRTAQYRVLAPFPIYALPHLTPDQQSLEPLADRHVIVMTTTYEDDRIKRLRKQTKVIQLPYSLPDMVQRGMTAQQIARYMRQAA